MNGVILRVNLPNYGNYEPAELTRILTRIGMSLITDDKPVATTEDFPCAYSLEEAKALTIQRGRDVKAGRSRLIPHQEVMKEMDQLIASYAD